MSARWRENAVQTALKLWRLQPVFIDTETNGLDDAAEIVEISIIAADGSPLVDTLVKPTGPIPWDVVRIHGITDEMVSGAPTWAEVWPEIKNILEERQAGIYNADFDLRMMRQSHRRHRMEWEVDENRFFCIMQLYTQFYGSYRWQKLEAAARQCGIRLPNVHRARADALLARAVFQYMVNYSGSC